MHFLKNFITHCAPPHQEYMTMQKRLLNEQSQLQISMVKKKWTQKDTTRTPVCAGDGMCLGYTSIQMTIFEKG